MAIILGIDPGGTTGLSLLDLESYSWHRSEVGPDEHHMELWSFLIKTEPDILICESFDYRIVESKGTRMPGVNLISREYIGLIKLYAELCGARLIMQSPSQGGGGTKHSGFWKNDKLKKVDLYKAPQGRQHMNDATRHVLYWLSFTHKDNHYLKLLR